MATADKIRKTEIRADMRRKRAALKPAWIADASAVIAGSVAVLPEFSRAGTVLCYLSLPEEVRTEAILDAAWRGGKRVAVPAFDAVAKEYAAAWLTPGTRVVPGHWNVPEPADPEWARDTTFDVALIPGVAFDPAGTRLGHGKGWYDRLLARLEGGIGAKIGIGFDLQIVSFLPREQHDIGMDAVVTERAVHRSGITRPPPARRIG